MLKEERKMCRAEKKNGNNEVDLHFPRHCAMMKPKSVLAFRKGKLLVFSTKLSFDLIGGPSCVTRRSSREPAAKLFNAPRLIDLGPFEVAVDLIEKFALSREIQICVAS